MVCLSRLESALLYRDLSRGNLGTDVVWKNLRGGLVLVNVLLLQRNLSEISDDNIANNFGNFW